MKCVLCGEATRALLAKPAKPTFARSSMPLSPASHSPAFSGTGFLPDLFSERGYSQFNETSKTNGYRLDPAEDAPGVLGKQAMLPPSGLRGNNNSEGAGGAGSFLTVTAYGAKG